jgi:hypothetical protein
MPDRRTLIAIFLTFSLAHFSVGYVVPIDFDTPITTLTGIALYTGYIYCFRTVIRIPIAIVITWRRVLFARHHYGLNPIESLRDGFVRGFLDTRRWTVGPLAMVDRVAVFALA